MNILIIEDEFLMLSFLKRRIEKENFEVAIASDGDRALALIDANKYDCILTDLMLPIVSGLELIAHIRTNTINHQTPIVVLSALSNEETMIEALAIGANDFIKKPLSLNLLIAKLKRLLEIKIDEPIVK